MTSVTLYIAAEGLSTQGGAKALRAHDISISILCIIALMLSLTSNFNQSARETKKYIDSMNGVATQVEEYCSQYPENLYIYDGTLVNDTRLMMGNEGIIGYNRMFWGGSTAFNAQYYQKLSFNGFDDFTSVDLFDDNVYFITANTGEFNESDLGLYLGKRFGKMQAEKSDEISTQVIVYKLSDEGG